MNQEAESILEGIRNGRRDILADFYQKYRSEFLNWIVSRYSCDADIARDVYQQSIIIFYENVVDGKLTTLTSSIKTYLFSIGKNKFQEMMRAQQKTTSIARESLDGEYDSTKETAIQQIERCLENLGEPCRSLLIQYYYHRQPLENLAGLFQYKNIESARNQKYKCLERLRKMVKEAQLTISS